MEIGVAIFGDPLEQPLAAARALVARGDYESAARLLLDAHRALEAARAAPADLARLRVHIGAVLGLAEAAFGFVEMQVADDDEEEEVVVGSEHQLAPLDDSPLALWRREHPLPVRAAPRWWRGDAPEVEGGFVVMPAISDWVLMSDDDDDDGRVELPLPSRCGECSVSVVAGGPGGCSGCDGSYCPLHAHLLERGLCVPCVREREQLVGPRKSHAQLFVFCRSAFAARRVPQLERVASRVPLACVRRSEALSVVAQFRDLLPLPRGRRVLCGSCGVTADSSFVCPLCAEHCCQRCVCSNVRVPSSAFAVDASGVDADPWMLPRCCTSCSRLVMHRICAVARARVPASQVGPFYDSHRVTLAALRDGCAALRVHMALWEAHPTAYTVTVRELLRSGDALLRVLAQQAQWLKANRGSRLVAALSAACADAYELYSVQLRAWQSTVDLAAPAE